MFKIGEFSQISRVPAKTLRYYDELGLLKPAQVDRFTGYRYYTAEQLTRLNRILALKELGLSLEQIADLLDNRATREEIIGMLKLRQTEARQQMHDARDRLARLEVRIRQIEQEGTMNIQEIVIKEIAPLELLSIRRLVPHITQMGAACGAMFNALYGFIGQHGVKETAPCMALYHMPEGFHEENIDTEIALVIDPETLPAALDAELTRRTLPGATVASYAHHGPYDLLTASYSALGQWIAEQGYAIQGPSREIYLHMDANPAEHVTEIQFPVYKP